MMNRLKTESGSTLVITLFVLTMFLVLGMALVTLTTSGVTKGASREHKTQATELADKNLLYVTKSLEFELQQLLQANKEGMMLEADFEKKLLEILNKYKCEKITTKQKSKTGTGESCIVNIADFLDQNNKVIKSKRLVTFKTIGSAENRDTTVLSDVVVGANSFPNQLKYALSTHIPPGDESSRRHGSMWIMGPTQIYGDMKVGRNLFVSQDYPKDQNNFSSGWALQQGSSNISAVNQDDPLPPELNIGDTIYKFDMINDTKTIYYGNSGSDPLVKKGVFGSYYNYWKRYFFWNNRHLKNKDGRLNTDDDTRGGSTRDNALFTKQDNLRNVFPTSKLRLNSTSEKLAPVSISESIKTASKVTGAREFKFSTSNENTISNEVITYIESHPNSDIKIINSTPSDTPTLRINLNNTSGKTKNLQVKSLYVEGIVEIANSNLELDGAIYATGKLNTDPSESTPGVIIKNSTIYSNTIIYSDKKFDVDNSTLLQKTTSDNKGNLIVFSNGIVDFKNLPNNSVIHGFFQSNDDMIFDATKSSVEIMGGISGKKLAILSGGSTNKPNFTVTYDKDIIQSYLDGIEKTEVYVNQVAPSVIKNKELQ